MSEKNENIFEELIDEQIWQLAFEHSFSFPGSQTEEEFDSKQKGFYFGYLQAARPS